MPTIYYAEIDQFTSNDLDTLKKAKEEDIAVLFYGKDTSISIEIHEVLATLALEKKYFLAETDGERSFYAGMVYGANMDAKNVFLTEISLPANIKELLAGKNGERQATRTRIRKSKEQVADENKALTGKKKVGRKPKEKAEIDAEKPEEGSAEVREPINTAESDISTTTIFIKQMAVRARDLNAGLSDEELAKGIARVLKEKKNKDIGLQEALELSFGEKDAKTIYGWIKPNVKKLTELAEQLEIEDKEAE